MTPAPDAGAILRDRAARDPHRVAFRYLPDGETEGEVWTYAALDARARAIAAALQAAGLEGRPVLLLFTPGLGFVAGFFGCLYAGAIAVPIDLPAGAEAARRVAAIAADAGVAAVLADAPVPALDHLPRLDLAGADGPWRAPALAPDAPAFLQYTSGSTASPKGVVVTHANVLANQRLIRAAAEQGRDAVFLSWLPLFHDMGLMGMVVQPVWVGAPCVLMPPTAFLARPVRWLRAISTYRATISGGPDFAFALAAQAPAEGLDLSCWEVAYSGAEPVRAATMAAFAARFGPAGLRPGSLYPCYGLAEATAFFTGGARGAGVRTAAGADGRALVACGFARDGHALRIVDPATGADAEAGEIWLAGPSVAAGYWRNPEATAATFGGGWLRTGDLGFLHGGEVVVQGRLKDLVIVRGRKHHPQDLEATVRASHPALEAGEGAAFTVAVGGEERLCVVHELRPAQRDAPGLFEAVRAALAAGHGVEPHAVCFIKRGSLPKTSSGKVRRRATRDAYLAGGLATVAVEARVAAAGPARDLTPNERRLAALWHEILGRGPDAPDADFFALGGDSLAAMRLVARVEEAWGVALPLAALAEAPTLARLAGAIAAGRPAEPWPAAVPAPEAAHQAFPLNPIQLAYALGRDAAVTGGGVATHAYLELDLPALDVPRLERAIDALVARHPMLRAVFLPGERQRILPEAPPYRVRVSPGAAEATRAAMSHQVLPADRWPLFDVRATALPGGAWRLHVGVDLLIADAWSLRLAARELAALYADPEAPLPPLGLTFRDYVLAEAALADTPARARAWAYWEARLATLPPPPDLPEAAASDAPPAFARRQTVLDPATWRALKRRAAAHGLTPTGVLLAAYARVLAAWNGGKAFTLNVTLFQRLPLHPDVDRLIGDFTSLTLLAVDAPGDAAFGAAARALATRLWQDLDHRLVGGLEVMRALARTQDRPTAAMPVVFTSTLVDGDADAAGALPPGVAIAHAVSQTPQVTLDHQVHQLGGRLYASWDALEARFPPGVLDAMVAVHGALLHALAADDAAWEAAPDLLPAADAAAIAAANATAADIPPAPLHAAFAARRAEAPDAPAVIAGGVTHSYAAVGRVADGVATRLAALRAEPDAGMGPSPAALVAVVMDKGWEQVAAVLGVLAAGAAYVPIDPGVPEARLHDLLRDAGARAVVTTPSVDARLAWPAGVARLVVTPDLAPEGPLPDPPAPSDPAYVIYTSGSTGKPKGVVLDHAAAWNTIADVNARFGVGPGDRVLALSSLGFDLSVWDVFGLLAAGGAVVMPTPAEARDPAAWLRLLREAGVTVWNTVPALMELLVEHAEETATPLPAGLRLAMFSGDWIPLSLPGRLAALAPACRAVSLGGATEAAIWSILHPIDAVDPAWRSVPYGRPMANQRFHVLDAALNPVPAGVAGGLYIAGDGLARGYWNDPARTAAAFFRHPRTGERLYRTGDLGRRGPDGTIEFLGREDHQVKVAGHRIELGEVEAALLAHPAVRAAVVAPDGPARGARRLLAWVVADADGEALRAFVATKLPGYMVPALVLPLDALPLGPNGKVDRARLAAPAAAPGDDAPRTPAERLLAALWREVLGVERVGRGDAFFALGGDSLAALRFLSRLRARHGRELTFGSLFASPSLAALAVAYEAAPTAAEIQPVARGALLPLSFAQERLWFLDRLAPGTAAYHVPLAVHVAGDLDPVRLEAALAAVLARHEGLRAGFVEVDGAPQVRIADAVAARVAVVDATADDDAALAARLRAEAGRPFALDRPPLLRLTLFRRGPAAHVLALTLHHLVCDGWSLATVTQELSAAYLGEPLPPPDAVQYADYAHWERTAMAGARLDAPLAYWRERLAGRLPVVTLPTDAPRPLTGPGATATALMPAALASRLEALGRDAGATLFMVLLAGFKAWLFAETGEADMLVAVAAANRRHPETQATVGLFVDTLAMRTDLGGDPAFTALLGRVRETVTGAQAHQELPLQRLVEALGPARDAGGVPVVRVGFGMQATGMPTLSIGGLDLAPAAIETGAARADLTLLVWREAEGLRVVAEYRRDLFAPETVAGWLAAYEALLAAAAADPTAALSALTGRAAGPRAMAAVVPAMAAAFVAPRTPTEARLAAIWEALLGRAPIGVTDDFFALGGHSLMAIRLLARVKAAFGREVPLGLVFEGATIERLAAALDVPADDVLVRLAPGEGPPIVLVHPVDGDVACYRDLAAALAPRPVWALQAPGLVGEAMPATIDALAARYAARLREAGLGPVHVAGWSLGGLVAHELARQLGPDAAGLTLIDSHLATAADAAALAGAEAIAPGLAAVAADLARMATAWTPRPYAGGAAYVGATAAAAGPWRAHVAALDARVLPGDHFALVRPPLVRDVAAVMASRDGGPVGMVDPSA